MQISGAEQKKMVGLRLVAHTLGLLGSAAVFAAATPIIAGVFLFDVAASGGNMGGFGAASRPGTTSQPIIDAILFGLVGLSLLLAIYVHRIIYRALIRRGTLHN